MPSIDIPPITPKNQMKTNLSIQRFAVVFLFVDFFFEFATEGHFWSYVNGFKIFPF